MDRAYVAGGGAEIAAADGATVAKKRLLGVLRDRSADRRPVSGFRRQARNPLSARMESNHRLPRIRRMLSR